MSLAPDEDTPPIGSYGAQRALTREVTENSRLIRELRDSVHLVLAAVFVPYALMAIYLIKVLIKSSVLW